MSPITPFATRIAELERLIEQSLETRITILQTVSALQPSLRRIVPDPTTWPYIW